MSKGQPFFFDTNVFDADSHEEPDDSEDALKYTEDQLALARNASFNEGKKAGVTATQASIEKDVLVVAQKIAANVQALQECEQKRREVYEAEAVHLAYCIVAKVFPVLFDQIGQETLLSSMRDILATQNTKHPIQVNINPDLLDPLQERLEHLTAKGAAHLSLVPSSAVPRHECRLEWPHGGAILAPEETAGKILALLQETLADHGISVQNRVQQQNAENSPEDKPDEDTGDSP